METSESKKFFGVAFFTTGLFIASLMNKKCLCDENTPYLEFEVLTAELRKRLFNFRLEQEKKSDMKLPHCELQEIDESTLIFIPLPISFPIWEFENFIDLITATFKYPVDIDLKRKLYQK